MPYNLTGIVSNSSNVLGFYQGVNEHLMQGWFGLGLMIGIAVVIFIAFVTATNDTAKSFAAASFVSLGMTLLLMAIDLIQNPVVLIAVSAICAASVAFSWRK